MRSYYGSFKAKLDNYWLLKDMDMNKDLPTA